MSTVPDPAQNSNVYPEKRCTKCQQLFPATPEFFNRNKECKYGVTSTCKIYDKNRKKPGILPPEGTLKQCTTCKDIHPATPQFFNRQTSCHDGLRPECKKCTSAKHKAHYRKPDVHEKALADRKEYRENPANHEKIRQANKQWLERPENQNYKRNYTREYRNDPDVLEKHRTFNREYAQRSEVKTHRLEYERNYLAIPEKREHRQSRDRVNQHTRRSRKREIEGTHTTDQIQDQLKRQKYKCYYAACGHAKFKKENGKYIYHIEHTYPLSRVAGQDIPANDMDYIVLACPDCNMSKGDKRPHEWPEGGKLL